MTNDIGIEMLIEEYNKMMDEIFPVPEYVNSKNNDSIRVLALSSSKIVGFKDEIANILAANVGDDLLFILDANGWINVRKSTDKLMLEPNEKFISVSKISASKIYEGKAYLIFRIPKDITKILNIKEKERIVWMLDNKNNVIIKDTLLSDNCIIKGEILDISAFSYQSMGIPEIVRDLLFSEAGDVIVFAIKNDNVIVKSFADIENLKRIAISTISISMRASFNKTLKSFTNSKDGHLLWILDMDGDIILRNTILPNTCI